MAPLDHISIEGLRVEAIHGLLPNERTDPQPFIFDLTLFANLRDAGRTDDIALTVNYSEVCQTVIQVATENRFFLIERLAEVVAESILHRFPMIDRLRLHLRKPEAPVDAKFASVGVCIERGRSNE